ncbi:MAG: type II secretion system F family protein [Alphaproteobacteria bacterium]|nr:type II secretion system F family protein [Alphaproteobacteria bacterium]
MILTAQNAYLIGGGIFAVAALVILALTSEDTKIEKRLERVSSETKHLVVGKDRSTQNSIRSTKDSAIPVLDLIVKKLPNPDKLRHRLGSTGKNISLGEYFLMNTLSVFVFYTALNFYEVESTILMPISIMLGLGLPHAVTGFMIARRIKKFLGNFPEAIDTMCRGIRSGLPITESVKAIGREMPDPVGIEFRRISDGVRMGKTLEDAMWEVAQRVDVAEFRFLIVAMAIQKETGGNLAETLGNLADLIRKRRQLRMKVKAMSSEAKASAMIIGSLPFIMFTLLLIVNPEYANVLLTETKGKILLGIGLGWMSLGWGVMMKMTHFEL